MNILLQQLILKQDINENFSHDSVIYSIYRAFEKYEVNLCGLCTLEFSSYNPEFFGFSKNKIIHPDNVQFLESIEPSTIEKDKYCKNCDMRLAYLLFIQTVRALNKEVNKT
jgi:protein-arginine kinase activator protein McsA